MPLAIKSDKGRCIQDQRKTKEADVEVENPCLDSSEEVVEAAVLLPILFILEGPLGHFVEVPRPGDDLCKEDVAEVDLDTYTSKSDCDEEILPKVIDTTTSSNRFVF
jgi:hypothetical protein